MKREELWRRAWRQLWMNWDYSCGSTFCVNPQVKESFTWHKIQEQLKIRIRQVEPEKTFI